MLVWDTDRGKFEQRFALTVFNVGPLTFGKAKIDDDLPGKSDGDGDAAIEPEETIEYVLGVNNRGTPEVQNVSATLISSAEFIEFLPGEDRLRFRSIAGKSERALAASYVFEVAEEDSINATQFDFKLMTRAQCRGLVYSWIRPYTEKLLLSPEKLKALQDRSPARADGPKKFKNSIGMEMVLIPAGEFQMGSNEFDAEKPIHTVKITKPFHMSSTEVTQAQYEAVMGKNPSSFKGKDLPVETISWEEAVEFCKKLSWKEKKSYRLPTEAEWEYACRSGTKTKFSFGDSENNLGDYAWYWQNSDRKTHPVGEKKSNAWGLFDMHGNVWEWCSDRYGEYPSGTVTDPTGHNTDRFRVIRGGGWCNSSRACRSAIRARCRPAFRFGFLGFRVA
ncbi:MAG: formylglycine-generating enzyme family protein, partial [Planctomycetota bacterium]|nr:formylglycine-generating enzyme family protein [Planctomycetota bacterium]